MCAPICAPKTPPVSAAPDASNLLASRFDQWWLGGDSILYDNSVWRIAADDSVMTGVPPL